MTNQVKVGVGVLLIDEQDRILIGKRYSSTQFMYLMQMEHACAMC